MYRIDNNSAVPTLPAPGPVGAAGFFTDGNPAAALEATIVDAWWCNIIQEEILAVVTAAGIAPRKDINTQLLQALQQLFSGTGDFLPLAGGEMTGFITLHAPPALPMHAANRQYVDDAINTIMSGTGYVPEGPPGPLTYGRLDAAWNPVLPLTGGALSGPGHLNISGTLNVTSGRGLSSSADRPSFCWFDNSIGSSWAMWNNQGWLHFGAADSSGNPSSTTHMTFNTLGHITVYSAWEPLVYLQGPNATWSVMTRNDGYFLIGLHAGGPATGRVTINPANGHVHFNSSTVESLGVYWARNGDCRKPGGGPWNDTSDDRVKKNVEPYSHGLDEVRQLRPVQFQFNGLANTADDGQTYHGLMAQETREVMPEMVYQEPTKLRPEDEEDANVYMMNSTALTYALVNAVQELAARLETLERRS